MIGRRFEARVCYSEPGVLDHKVFVIYVSSDDLGHVTIEDRNSGEIFELLPSKADELGRTLRRAARWTGELK